MENNNNNNTNQLRRSKRIRRSKKNINNPDKPNPILPQENSSSSNSNLQGLEFENLNQYIVYNHTEPRNTITSLITIQEDDSLSLTRLPTSLPSLSYFTYILLILVNDFTHDHMKNTERAYNGKKKGKEKGKEKGKSGKKTNKKSPSHEETSARKLLYGNVGQNTSIQDNSIIVVFSYVIYLIRNYIPSTPEQNYESYRTMMNNELFCNFKYFIDHLEFKQDITKIADKSVENRVNLLLATLRILFNSYLEIYNSLISKTRFSKTIMNENCILKEPHCRSKLGTFNATNMETNVFQLFNTFAHDNHYTIEVKSIKPQSIIQPYFTSNAYIQGKSYTSTHKHLTSHNIYSHDYKLNTLATITDSQNKTLDPIQLGYYIKDSNGEYKEIDSTIVKKICTNAFELPNTLNQNKIENVIHSDENNKFQFSINVSSSKDETLSEGSKTYQEGTSKKKTMQIYGNYLSCKVEIKNVIEMNGETLVNSTEIFDFSKAKKRNPCIYSTIREKWIDKINNSKTSLKDILYSNMSNNPIQFRLIHDLLDISSRKTFGDLYQILTTFSVNESTFPTTKYGYSDKKYIVFGNHDLTASIIFNFMLFFLKESSIPERCCMIDHYNDTNMFTKRQAGIRIDIPISMDEVNKIAEIITEDPSFFAPDNAIGDTNEIIENESEISNIVITNNEVLNDFRAGLRRKKRKKSRSYKPKKTQRKRKLSSTHRNIRKNSKNIKRTRRKRKRDGGGSPLTSILKTTTRKRKLPTDNIPLPTDNIPNSEYTPPQSMSGVKKKKESDIGRDEHKLRMMKEEREYKVQFVIYNIKRMIMLFENIMTFTRKRLDILEFGKDLESKIQGHDIPQHVYDFLDESNDIEALKHLGMKNHKKYFKDSDEDIFVEVLRYDDYLLFLKDVNIYDVFNFRKFYLTTIAEACMKYQDGQCIC